MIKKRFEIRYYKEPNSGNEPAYKFINSLNKHDKEITMSYIRLLLERWPATMPLVRCMKNGLYELRIRLFNRQARVFFLVDKDSIILLHGFIKKTQTTPSKELNLAYKRLQIYLFNKKDHYE